MSEAAGSLDQLNDIVTPPSVPWFPLAPGWYVLGFLLLVTVIGFAVVAWQRWRANAYRRSAIQELAKADSPARISELLRRTALVSFPRSELAAVAGEAWVGWLADQYPGEMPGKVRQQLGHGVYGTLDEKNLNDAKAYAAKWISEHRVGSDSASWEFRRRSSPLSRDR